MIKQRKHPVYKLPKIINDNSFLVITDYNMLPAALEESWIFDFTDNYLIYDKAHRFEPSDKIIHQENVGANVYDIFDYISNHYYNLPDTIIFCKANVIPRHCGFRKFISIVNNTEFTSIENYIRESPKFSPGCSGFVTDDDEYFEHISIVNGQVINQFGYKHIKSYEDLIFSIFENPVLYEYTRFAPGCNYILTKNDILRYNLNFYNTMKLYCSWSVQPGEAYFLERAMYTLFNNNFKIRDLYESK